MIDDQYGFALDSPLLTRLLPRLASIATDISDAGLAALEGAGDLPPTLYTREVLPAIVAGSVLLLEATDERRRLGPDEIAEIVMPITRQQAEERIPLRLLITSVFGSVRRVWSEIASSTTESDLPDQAALVDLLLDVMGQVVIAVVETYSDVEQSIYSAEREARRALCSALLHGGPTEDLAARADTTLTTHYDVLALLTSPADPVAPLADTAGGRRRIRVVQQALDRLAGSTALTTFDGTSGIALLPARTDAGCYSTLAVDLSADLGADVLVIESRGASLAGIPVAAREATELAELAHCLGRPTGTYGMHQLMFEYQLTRPGRARDALAACIQPVVDHPHLLDALEAHFKHDGDRKAAANDLHIHPNSLSYRLRRITELTGADPATPDGARLLGAAMMIHQLYPRTNGH
ncbi:PucR family transcriptional regulator [Nocardia niigatensis]|uniref:PucR family transcriptional regulator n=1 Tax=Nocardia niigatensis TaxID=209249 RepID=UPI0002E12434|nr:helix-turn-helix domain-containing protein [Nocardia niigatensis]